MSVADGPCPPVASLAGEEVVRLPLVRVVTAIAATKCGLLFAPTGRDRLRPLAFVSSLANSVRATAAAAGAGSRVRATAARAAPGPRAGATAVAAARRGGSVRSGDGGGWRGCESSRVGSSGRCSCESDHSSSSDEDAAVPRPLAALGDSGAGRAPAVRWAGLSKRPQEGRGGPPRLAGDGVVRPMTWCGRRRLVWPVARSALSPRRGGHAAGAVAEAGGVGRTRCALVRPWDGRGGRGAAGAAPAARGRRRGAARRAGVAARALPAATWLWGTAAPGARRALHCIPRGAVGETVEAAAGGPRRPPRLSGDGVVRPMARSARRRLVWPVSRSALSPRRRDDARCVLARPRGDRGGHGAVGAVPPARG